MGLQWVQGVTRGERGLQEVTGGYKELQKTFFYLERSQTFSLVHFA